jgi:putative SOS response-associated peptidase YedK
MPVILKPEDEARWLNLDIVEPEQLLPLLTPYPSEAMVCYEVSSQVNSYHNDIGSSHSIGK